MGVLGKVAEALLHPDEIPPLWQMYCEAKRVKALTQGDADRQFCYDMLNRVSRSFAIVIQQLPAELRDPVCVFYLVLRALDTIEDDMALPVARKLPLLRSFHERIADTSFSMDDCGDKDYRTLMQRYPAVARVCGGLDARPRAVIADITRRMGAGMAEFIELDVVTVAQYDRYCHYVAGLVGIGLCHLFASAGCESPEFDGGMDDLANDMGLFLQKTNIIRDYLEDILEEPAPRMFWPREIWGNYADDLAAFKDPANRPAALRCLNHMVTDALRHAPQCLRYMARLQHPQVFKFCAIPQVMAAATLALCYDNGAVFEGVVKMRRGATAKVFATVGDMGDLYQQFASWCVVLRRKARRAVRAGDPTAPRLLKAVDGVLEACETGCRQLDRPLSPPAVGPKIAAVAVCAAYLTYTLGPSVAPDTAPLPPTDLASGLALAQQIAALLLLLLSLAFLLL